MKNMRQSISAGVLSAVMSLALLLAAAGCAPAENENSHLGTYEETGAIVDCCGE